MLLIVLILFVIANAVATSIVGLTAFDKPKGFERNLLLVFSGLLLANLAGFLTIYATYYGISH